MQSITLNLHFNNGKDRLTTLPSEIQQNIIAHLLTTHDPDNPPTCDERKCKRPPDHALDKLAATSKSLHTEVMTFARSWLIINRDSLDLSGKTKTERPAGKRRSLERNYLRGMFM